MNHQPLESSSRHAIGSTQRLVLKRALIVALVAAPLLAALAVDLPLCPLAAITGLPCPGCGLTRATLAAVGGDFAGALRLHPLVFWVAPIYGLLGAALIVGYVQAPHTASAANAGKRRSDFVTRVLLGRVTSVIAALTIALLLTVWILRFFGLLGGPVPVQSIAEWRSHVESKVHDVAVADHVVLADD
jgi:hypothetical protein